MFYINNVRVYLNSLFNGLHVKLAFPNWTMAFNVVSAIIMSLRIRNLTFIGQNPKGVLKISSYSMN